MMEAEMGSSTIFSDGIFGRPDRVTALEAALKASQQEVADLR